MSRATLSLENLRFRYPHGSWSLDIPELDLGAERMTAIVGPNGSGKSTLLRIAAGVTPADEGVVRYAGQILKDSPRRQVARQLGFLPQVNPSLFDLTVQEVAELGRYAHGTGMGFLSPQDRQAVHRALETLEMMPLADRPISRLSGGERRRAFLASLLAQEPEMLLLDEPTSALDVHHAADLMRQLTAQGDAGPAVVLVTHDLNLAALYSHRMLLIEQGRICADGNPDEVLRSTALRDAYADELILLNHPETGGPVVLPRGNTLREVSSND